MDTDPEYMDELTKILPFWGERSRTELIDMLGASTDRVTKVVTRWSNDDRPDGIWVFVSGGDKAHVYAQNLTLGHKEADTNSCVMFLRSLEIPIDLVEGVSQEVMNQESTVTFIRADKGWKAMAVIGTLQ